MVDRADLLQAIAAQEQLRGSVPDEVVDAAIAALRAQLDTMAAQLAPEQARRRQATVVFADVAGFTALSETLDAEVVAGLMNELWASVDAVIDQHGGRVDKHIGDAVMGVWGVDGAREDDPERAVRAALALRAAFVAFRSSADLAIDVRIGVNTGPVLFGRVGTTGEVSVTGDAVNVASRMEHAAPPGSVLISHDTYRHVRSLFDVQALEPLAVKGKSAPLRAYVVEGARSHAFRLGLGGIEGVETRMVGRHRELGVLQDAFVDAVRLRQARVVTVMGEAGEGKSRLLEEFSAWLDDRAEVVRCLKGRFVPDLQRVPRGLLRQMFAERHGVFDDDPRPVVVEKLRSGLTTLHEREADVLAHWLGFDLSDSPAVVDLVGSSEFGTVAQAHLTRHVRALLDRSPLVVVLEDLHWADTETLDAITHLVEQLAGTALLVVCSARHVFAAQRPEWGAGPGRAELVELQALAADEAAALVRELLQGTDPAPAALVDVIVEQADGNPFYIEELVKMLLDDGVIVAGEGGGARVGIERMDELTVPPTLAGVLQARLDALGAGELTALQHAAVVGRVFWDDAVATLLSDTASAAMSREAVIPVLDAVRTKELVRPNERPTFSGAAEFMFKHALLRDVTYETVLLDDRRRLHGLAASWLQARAGARLGEHLGPLAEHLLQAGDHLAAAKVLEQAAAGAVATGAAGAAAGLYERALGLRAFVGEDHTVDAAMARVELIDVLLRVGDLDATAEQLEIAAADADRLGEPHLLALVLVHQGGLAISRGQRDVAAELFARAGPVAEEAGGRALAELLLTRGQLEEMRGDATASLRSSVTALECSRDLGDGELELRSLNSMAAACSRLGRHDEAERHVREAMAIARRLGNTGREAMLLNGLGASTHLRAADEPARLVDAIELYRASIRLYDALALDSGTVLVLGNLVQAEIEAGLLDVAADHARDHLRWAHRRGLTVDVGFGVLIHGQLAIAAGDRATGLRLIGAAMADPRAEPQRGEVDRILAVHGIPTEEAAAGMAAGRDMDLDSIVLELLDEGDDAAGIGSMSDG